MAQARAEKIKLLLYDVDGVATDGTIWLIPVPPASGPVTQDAPVEHVHGSGYGFVNRNVVESKGFHAHDGTAVSLARVGGIKMGLITRRISETVAVRARDLRLDYVYQGVADKWGKVEEILAAEGITAEEVAYVGDDIIDLPVMRRCGLALAVPNARDEVKQEAHHVTDHKGGEGAVRDAVEYILRAQGKLEGVIEQYLEELSPAKPGH